MKILRHGLISRIASYVHVYQQRPGFYTWTCTLRATHQQLDSKAVWLCARDARLDMTLTILAHVSDEFNATRDYARIAKMLGGEAE